MEREEEPADEPIEIEGLGVRPEERSGQQQPVDEDEHPHDADMDPAVDDVPIVHYRGVIKKPTPREVEEQRVTHLPYRPWCATCVAAKGTDDPHRRTRNNQDQGP